MFVMNLISIFLIATTIFLVNKLVNEINRQSGVIRSKECDGTTNTQKKLKLNKPVTFLHLFLVIVQTMISTVFWFS